MTAFNKTLPEQIATGSAAQTPMSLEELAHLGEGQFAYVKLLKSQEAQALFPQAPALAPGLSLYALLGASGMPILLTDSKDLAIANAWENKLETVSLH